MVPLESSLKCATNGIKYSSKFKELNTHKAFKVYCLRFQGFERIVRKIDYRENNRIVENKRNLGEQSKFAKCRDREGWKIKGYHFFGPKFVCFVLYCTCTKSSLTMGSAIVYFVPSKCPRGDCNVEESLTQFQPIGYKIRNFKELLTYKITENRKKLQDNRDTNRPIARAIFY